MKKNIALLLVCFYLFCQPNAVLFAQANSELDRQLAKQYTEKREFEKANVLLEKIYKQNPSNQIDYNTYFNTLIELKNYPKAEKIAKEQSKRNPKLLAFQVDRAFAIKQQENKKDKADELYKDIIKDFEGNTPPQVYELAQAFTNRDETEWAIETYKKGQTLNANPYLFANELADLYFKTNETNGMISAYLDMLETQPYQLGFIQNMLQNRLEQTSDYNALKNILVQKVQKNPNNTNLIELLVWFFVQQKDYNAAFIQAKALDKRLIEQAQRLIYLAQTARENQNYAAATQIYQHIIDKNDNSPNYRIARTELLDTQFENLTENDISNKTKLFEGLEIDYQNYLKQFGADFKTADVQRGLARLQALHLNKLDSAIALLEKTIALTNIKRQKLAQIKLELADYYVMSGEMWESALLYGQVDLEFKQDVLGQDAKFRNARLSFYKGDFEWAQAQFDVLKSATTQKIANDAIALSLLIMDNLGMDSTLYPMQLYAEADLLAFRNQNEAALTIYDSLLKAYPQHTLTDETYFGIAKIKAKQMNYEQALTYYQKIITQFPSDILADDALMAMAILYENKLQNTDKAKELYQELMLNYANSIFAVEARKRFRTLRGDFKTIN